MLALDTLVDDDGFTGFLLRADRFHQATAACRTVSRINIHMFAPQAVRTMVGIAVTNYAFAAVFTDEVFGAALELSSHFIYTQRASDAKNIDCRGSVVVLTCPV